jgi:hypothetical protein
MEDDEPDDEHRKADQRGGEKSAHLRSPLVSITPNTKAVKLIPKLQPMITGSRTRSKPRDCKSSRAGSTS